MNNPNELEDAEELAPDFELLSQQASQVFIPASPITSKDLFAGRINQMNKVIDAINQVGQHAIIYGERGVGKTSLANVLAPLSRALNPNSVSAKVNCDATDTFDAVWRKALNELNWVASKPGIGFTSEIQREVHTLAEQLPAPATPNDLRLLLGNLPVASVLIFDEFDRLPHKAAKVFTDLIKSLSDYAVPTTIILVGVASTVEQLIRDHASVERALVQIPMPRMELQDLRQIIHVGAQKLGMTFERNVVAQIVQISQGLPHYTHLVSLYAARHALEHESVSVNEDDLSHGLQASVENAHHSLKTQYHAATSSSHKSALFEQVLLACALAKKDQLSFFRAADVEGPLSAIMKKSYDVPAFARHLSEFCTQPRASVLEKQGVSRRMKYRFSNPLIEPFIVINGRARSLITAETLAKLTSSV
jgi:Cdc6-like AAA superfamily ATPase